MQPVRPRMVDEGPLTSQEVPCMPFHEVGPAEAAQVRLLPLRARVAEPRRASRSLPRMPVQDVGPACSEAAVPQMRIQVDPAQGEVLRRGAHVPFLQVPQMERGSAHQGVREMRMHVHGGHRGGALLFGMPAQGCRFREMRVLRIRVDGPLRRLDYMPPLRKGPPGPRSGRDYRVLVGRQALPALRLLRRIRVHLPVERILSGGHPLRSRGAERDEGYSRTADVHDVGPEMRRLLGHPRIQYGGARGGLSRQCHVLHPQAQSLGDGCCGPRHPFHRHGSGGDSDPLRHGHRGRPQVLRQDNGGLCRLGDSCRRLDLHRRPDIPLPIPLPVPSASHRGLLIPPLLSIPPFCVLPRIR